MKIVLWIGIKLLGKKIRFMIDGVLNVFHRGSRVGIDRLMAAKSTKIFILLIFQFTFIGCSSDSNNNNDNRNPAEKMLESLGPATKYYVLGEGYSSNASIVLLGLQGGPVDYLFKKGKVPQFIELYPYFTVVHVHQAQTLPINTEDDGLDARLLSGDEIISMEKAKRANLKSAAIIHKVAQYFKDQEKTVYVIGHSFGSFLLPHTLVQYGNNFDKVLITAGRIDMPLEVVSAFKDACGGGFDKDTQEFVPNDCDRESKGLSKTEKNIFKSEARLLGDSGESRYSELLKDKDLSNVMYVYGTKDESTGSLNASEVSFLKSKKVSVIAMDEGHGLVGYDSLPDTKTLKGFSEESKAQVFYFLQSPLVSSYSLLDFPADNILNLYFGSENDLADDKFDIGIVFEGHNKKQISYKMNELFGNGPYSLFKTNVFKKNKSKIRIYYGQITQSTDSSTYPASVNSSFYRDYFTKLVQVLPDVVSEASLDLQINPLLKKEQVAKSDLKIYHYMSVADKKNYDSRNTLTNQEQTHKATIDRNIARFTSFFNHANNASKVFDLKIYVSSGLEKSHTDYKGKIIYLKSGEFFNGMPSMGIHPHLFAMAGVHEIGHGMGNLSDENRDYEVETKPQNKSELYPATDQNSIKFRNNCFSGYELTGAKISNVTLGSILNLASEEVSYYTVENFDFDLSLVDIHNPWTHPTKVPVYGGVNDDGQDIVNEWDGETIGNYDGRIYPGCCGFKSFRGTRNSIMRGYYGIKPSEWLEKSWGPINSFYLRKSLEGYQ